MEEQNIRTQTTDWNLLNMLRKWNKKDLCGCSMEGKNTPLGWWLIQDKRKMPPLESFPNTHKMRLVRRKQFSQLT